MTGTYLRPGRDELRGHPLLAAELHTLYLASHGYTNAQIGRMLEVSENTIKSRMRQVMAKLDARDRAHAVRRGFEEGHLRASQVQQVAS